MDNSEFQVPIATQITGVYWDSDRGLAKFDTDHGQRFYDLQALSWLIMECRNRGFPSECYELAYRTLATYSTRFRS